MVLRYSPHESDALGIRIARGTKRFPDLPVEALKKEIAEGRFDLCKIKVPADNKKIFHDLNDLGFPYQIMSVLYRNVKVITDEDGQYQLPEGIDYEPFDGSQADVLGDFVVKAVGVPTGVSFDVWPLNKMLEPEKELELSRAYAMGFDHKPGNNKLAWLLKDNGEYVGFFMGFFEEDYFEGTLYGVPPENRLKGYGKIIYDIMKKICFERGARYFYTDVQLQNFASQRSTLHGGLQPTSFFFHIFLSTFADFEGKKAVSASLDSSSETELQNTLTGLHLDSAETAQFRLATQHSVNYSKGNFGSIETYERFADDASKLWVSKLENEHGELARLIYSKYNI